MQLMLRYRRLGIMTWRFRWQRLAGLLVETKTKQELHLGMQGLIISTSVNGSF
uniref:Uncharacterized protein n=1 Tax=Arundo donax TaxID=35708 RepID=A0A0A9G7B0_ARUDO